MGYDKAFRMVALSEIYDAQTALALGLATEVVTDNDLEDRTLEVARGLVPGETPAGVHRFLAGDDSISINNFTVYSQPQRRTEGSCPWHSSRTASANSLTG